VGRRAAANVTGAATRAGPSEVVRVLVDGRNVQRAMERGSSPGAVPTRTLIAGLRAAFPPPTEVELFLDGHRAGSPAGKVAPGLSVQFTRDASADAAIGARVAEAFRALGPARAWSIVVVTDDREVRDHARRHGVRVEGTAWLADRLAASERRGTGIGHGRAPRPRNVG
jgi:YacP-like NYN domain